MSFQRWLKFIKHRRGLRINDALMEAAAIQRSALDMLASQIDNNFEALTPDQRFELRSYVIMARDFVDQIDPNGVTGHVRDNVMPFTR